MRPPTASASTAAGSARSSAAQLAVDLDAQRLEGALGRVAAGPAGGGRDRRAHQLGEPGGAGERLPRPLPHDGVGDPAGEPLLAVLPQHPGQPRRLVGVDDVGRGDALRLVHPHVQRRVLGVGEAAPRPRRAAARRRRGRTARPAPVDAGALAAPRAARRTPRAPAWPARRTGASRSPPRARAPAGRGRARPAAARRTARAARRCARPCPASRRPRPHPGALDRGREQRERAAQQDGHVARRALPPPAPSMSLSRRAGW